MFQLFRNKEIRSRDGKVTLFLRPRADEPYATTDPYPTDMHARAAYREYVEICGLPNSAYLRWEGGFVEHICN